MADLFATGGVAVVGRPVDVGGAGREDDVPGEGAGIDEGVTAEAAVDEAAVGGNGGDPEGGIG